MEKGKGRGHGMKSDGMEKRSSHLKDRHYCLYPSGDSSINCLICGSGVSREGSGTVLEGAHAAPKPCSFLYVIP